MELQLQKVSGGLGMFRKSLMVVLCVAALLVGMSAFGASAHAAALRPPSVVGGGGSGGGCGGQPGSVTACIYISPARTPGRLLLAQLVAGELLSN